ncbi:hypothetical protein GCM10020331_016410 [Ectobacillus funiculus]
MASIIKGVKSKKVLFIGNDLSIHKETIIAALGEQAVFASTAKHNPRPSELGCIGLQKKSQRKYIHLYQIIFVWLKQKQIGWQIKQK